MNEKPWVKTIPLYRAKILRGDGWVYGYPCKFKGIEYVDCLMGELIDWDMETTILVAKHVSLIQSDTLSKSIEREDKNGTMIYEGDFVKLALPQLIRSDPASRIMLVNNDWIQREVVNYPDFLGDKTLVEIGGISFRWKGFDLLPGMIDGVSDISKMEVIGNFWDNTELIKEVLEEE